MKKTSQRSLLFRQNVNRTEEEKFFRLELILNFACYTIARRCRLALVWS